MKILAINPGSTSTKLAVYDDTTPVLNTCIRHSVEDLKPFSKVIDQFDFRKNLVLKALADNGIPFEFDAIIGRGGLLRPIPGGVYEVNDAMVSDIHNVRRSHACNLGCLIAHDLAKDLNCNAYTAYATHNHMARAQPTGHRTPIRQRADQTTPRQTREI